VRPYGLTGMLFSGACAPFVEDAHRKATGLPRVCGTFPTSENPSLRMLVFWQTMSSGFPACTRG